MLTLKEDQTITVNIERKMEPNNYSKYREKMGPNNYSKMRAHRERQKKL